jgi:membrane fusion protein (multidrug efflux system)
MFEWLRKLNTRQLSIIISTLVILLLIVLKLTAFSSSTGRSVRGGLAAQATLPVGVIVVNPQNFEETVRTTGTLQPNEEVILQSEVSGKILHIFFQEGKIVKKGQLLVKINDNELQAQLQRVQLQMDLASETEFRQRKQLEIGAISQETYDQFLSELNTLKAEKALIDARIEKTEIRAPFTGKIGLRYVSTGGIIMNNAKIASLIDNDPLKIEFAIPEKYSGQIEVGNKVFFKLQDSNIKYEAEIYAIEPKIDPATRTLNMRALYSNEQQNITPGTFADVDLVVRKKSATCMIPTEALIPELLGSKVYLLKNGKAVAAAVETGFRTNRLIEITSGLQQGDTVITTGILQLRPGTPVNLSKINEIQF